MKNYLYYFNFFSGEYSYPFYQQIKADSERSAIVQIVSLFTKRDEEATKIWLNEELGRNWSIKKFWDEIDLRFHNKDSYIGYTLNWIKETDFDLQKV